MEILSVLGAALAAFVLGSVWYMVLAESWMDAAKIPKDEDGKPEGGMTAGIFAGSFVLQLIVAGMMRHVFSTSGVDGIGAGFISGAGIGLFFISPWIAINNMYAMRPIRLSLIDGGYATVACAAMGLVLTLLS
ncbi:DUF1761 domain-containing protein [Primorskyibacter sp. S87]|uniref:DUF1761 domain-containing protein n=1 Tax=Primorskyibacter sp. S87 TaxID=3415126 RepID=UPI003C7A53AA